MRILARLYQILWQGDVEFAEIQGALLAFLWGMWFLLRYHYRENFVIYQVIDHPLTRPGRYEIWGLAFIIIGASQFIGLLLMQYKIRRVGAMSATLVWLFIGILTLQEWRSFSCPTAFSFAIGSAWGFIRIGYIYSEEGRRRHFLK